MTYIVMNNGCYGLTKGQDSATADLGSVSKSGSKNKYHPIDLVGLALQLGAGFVARSFSGDKEQLIPLFKAAINHKGFSFIDVISPCVTFNNNAGSTKSYDFTREYMEATAAMDYVPHRDEITVDYAKGKSVDVELHDGSVIRLRKPVAGWDPFDRHSAMNKLLECTKNGEILTGLLHINNESRDLHELLNTSDVPLCQLDKKKLCPGSEVLKEINKKFR